MNPPVQTVRVAAAVLNQTALDLAGNCERIRQALTQAKESHCQILCLPELCLTGYGCEDMFLSEGFNQSAAEHLLELAKQVDSLAVCVGLPISYEGKTFNGVALIAHQKILGIVAKQHLARKGLHYEPRWFRPWPAGKAGLVRIGQAEFPIGDLTFDLGGLKIGFEICEDAWVPDRPLPGLVKRGVDLILNPSASHFAFGKNEVRKKLIRDAVENFDVAYVYANLLGNEAGRAIYDGDSYIAAGGQILDSGPRFSFETSVLTARDLSFDLNQSVTNSPNAISLDFDWSVAPNQSPQATTAQTAAANTWESSSFRKEEEFCRAVALGLFDYIRKSRSNGIVVSLSGGADSAAVTCLARLMLQFAEADLSLPGLLNRLSYLPVFKQTSSENLTANDLSRELIYTAYQATQNSSMTTRKAAEAVASGCGSTHFELDIDPIVESYTSLLSQALQRELTWEQDDIALQNIQARSRSPSIWMFANIRNALLLSTSNRSEAAVGYATMDGDTSGGLAPIAGIDKAFLRQWLVWLEREGPMGFRPFPFLSTVNSQQPTAELRPQTQGQTDEDDLMPYVVLDFIERCAVRDKLMPREIVTILLAQFPSTSREQALFWIRRFFRLWCRNQWKRERYAPSFHLDDENLDPKTWCRFPILSGGFEEELSALT